MKAVIIAGGFGTRLKPLTLNTPKPIVPVANRRFIMHQIELLIQHGADEVIVNLHYLSDDIKQMLGDGSQWGIKIHYSIEDHPLGTAGAVKNAEEFFKDEQFIVVFNGDVLTDINISEIIKFHKAKKAQATITLTPVEDPTAYGLVLADNNSKVTQFLEKPSWERVEGLEKYFINAGIYILNTEIFKNIPKNKSVMFEHHVFPCLLAENKAVYGFKSDAYWIDIGSPKKYKEAHEAILRGEVTLVKIFGHREKGSVWVGEQTEIDKTAKIIGPALIGKEVKVGAESQVKNCSVVGDKVEIGKHSIIENTIIWEGCKIGDNVRLYGCVVGFNCKIEEGVLIAKGAIIADNSVIAKGSIFND
ncbi:MAG: mannose-1-phosphate guanylyltransferase [Candidatus Saganbacteria bacterium]|uniref:Mannose-1-phosphate guanylyltransferase n=1 Tax=Candidatus Saganbacteria bacterium TaxID=2575572 RepID=A0A833KZL5_UNCSA|nr:MAG: mannose-1-phosphate guanylyltransferase [Candidatus Saganbacteria bacterium]